MLAAFPWGQLDKDRLKAGGFQRFSEHVCVDQHVGIGNHSDLSGSFDDSIDDFAGFRQKSWGYDHLVGVILDDYRHGLTPRHRPIVTDFTLLQVGLENGSMCIVMVSFDDQMRRGGDAALREMGRFFMRSDPVYDSLRRVTSKLAELNIPYAVVGGMALVAHGYDRTTRDVDILVTSAGLVDIHRNLDGLGYVRPFKDSKNLTDTESRVRIEFLITGQFPGDGKPKAVAFPDPLESSTEIDGIRYLSLERLIELKLASGMSNALRAKDIGDVIELIRILKLGEDFDGRLNPYVRAKFTELRAAIEASGDAEI